MKLRSVLTGVRLCAELGSLGELEVAGLEYDSRKAAKDFLFFAFPGAKVDGRKFAADALERGACAVASAEPRPEDFAGPWIRVEHGRQALATAARTFYGKPDEAVHFTGITGTNGKSTTANLTESVLRSAGHITGLIGTIEYRMAGEVRPAVNTTPESLDVMRFAAELRDHRGSHLIAEVSSHALALGRSYGFFFHTAVFTNLTRDHLDFHRTMEEYAAAKRLLFAPVGGPAPRYAVLNADDPWSQQMTPAASSTTLTYGVSADASIRATNVESGLQGLRFDVEHAGSKHKFTSSLTGSINVSNILAATGVGLSYGMELPAIAAGIESCAAVPGRFERIDCGQPFLVVVDYAHTDDALRNVIRIARGVTAGRVITLFGCGGDRDRAKRPLMGMAAAELSDFVVLTSDNPRSEDPLAIINDALVGLRRFDTPFLAEPDRATAIREAIRQAKPGDAVILAGKGHETYQVLPTGTIAFDDREEARKALHELCR